MVHLTVDDGPSADFLNKVRFLHRHGIRDTIFYCVGKNLEKRRDMVVAAIQEGVVIGNHTYTHLDCAAAPLDQVEDEIRQTDALITELHREAGVPRKHWYFRFPYHRDRPEAMAVLKTLNYTAPPHPHPARFNHFTIDVQDYKHKDAFNTVDKRRYLQRVSTIRPTEVVVMHDATTTARLFRDAVYRMITTTPTSSARTRRQWRRPPLAARHSSCSPPSPA